MKSVYPFPMVVMKKTIVPSCVERSLDLRWKKRADRWESLVGTPESLARGANRWLDSGIVGAEA